jgi:hypothetical protein
MPQDTHETAPSQFAEAGGIRFAYRRFGRRGGTPLLLLGYFTANLDRWDPKVTKGFAAEREGRMILTGTGPRGGEGMVFEESLGRRAGRRSRLDHERVLYAKRAE